MYDKVQIFNLALGTLLLTKQVANTDSDPSSENKVLNNFWEAALFQTLQDLDLDATSSQIQLELIELNPNGLWTFSYKYPNDCAFLRRIQSSVLKDTRNTQIRRRVAVKGGQKVIFTEQEDAIAEYISTDVPLSVLSASAGLALSQRLAWLSSPLIAGKKAIDLKKEIADNYKLSKAEAQEHDRLENANMDTDEEMSEFVAARLS